MNILLCGAHGFIGRTLEPHLRQAGHTVVRAVHHPRNAHEIPCDYTRDHRPEDWLPRLAGIDAVINAVGILNESPNTRFEDLHTRAPIALFQACARASIQRVIQISALNAAPNAPTAYLASKGQADAALQALPISACILQPSLIFGPGGGSTEVFLNLARLPVHALPGGGQQQVQPVHINDVVSALCALLIHPNPPALTHAVGPSAVTYRDMLAHYRQAMGFTPALGLPIPRGIMRLSLAALARIPRSPFSPDTYTMLEMGSTANPSPFAQLLGHAPRNIKHFLEGAQDWANALQYRIAQHLARATLAFIWLMGALASLPAISAGAGYALLAQAGLGGAYAPVWLYAGITLDALMALLTLARPSTRLWSLQIAIVLTYTLILSVTLPALWLHPFGPLSKNIAVLALLLILMLAPPRPNAPTNPTPST